MYYNSLQADIVMKRRYVETIFLACVHLTVMTGLLLWKMPSCIADGSVTPDITLKAGQSESARMGVHTPADAANHADTTRNNPMSAEKLEKMPKVNNMKHISAKDHAESPMEKAAPGKSSQKVLQTGVRTFDMHELIERLKKTDAIGMFTKLVLRSDALDLMSMVKAYHKHIARYSLKELHARFNGLLLKVLTLLNDDPKLARDISLAREDIWKNLLQEAKA